MENIILKLIENTSIFEIVLIIVLGLTFYFRLKNHTEKLIEKLEDKIEKTDAKHDDNFKTLMARIDAVNTRLDNLYFELFKKSA